LKPGVSPQQAQADVERITRHIAEMFPAAKRGDLQILGVVAPLKQDVIGDYRKPLLVLFLAVCFVLLIAVVNVANLLLARGTGRQRQFAIQIALGAGARRVIGQSLIESVILGVIGGVLGLALAFGLTRSLVAMVPSNVPRLQTTSIDGEVLLFVLTVSVLAGIAFGAAPAFFALRTRVNENLKQGGRGTSGGVTTSDCAPVS
jgi:putative ABC transport system permease protein